MSAIRSRLSRKWGYPDHPDGPVPPITRAAFLMGCFTSLGGLAYGYNLGQISGLLEMHNFLEAFGQISAEGKPHFTNVRTGLIVGLFPLGALLGCVLAARLAARIGCRWSVVTWCLMNVLGIIIVMTSVSPKWYQVMVGRFFMGLGIGAITVVVPMYQSESSPRHVRGAIMVFFPICTHTGIFLSYAIEYGTYAITTSASWLIPVGISMVPVALLGGGILFLPETPRYDYRNDNIDRARKTMARMYGVPETHGILSTELEEMKVKLDEEHQRSKQTLREVLTTDRMGYRFLVGFGIGSLQQLTGSNYFFFYGTTVFTGTTDINPFVAEMILGVVSIVGTFIGLYLADRVGRRISLLGASTWMFCCFMIFASVGHFCLEGKDPASNPAAAHTVIAFACLFLLGFSGTWSPIAVIVYSELYPARYRPIGMAVSSGSYWLWNFLVGFFTPFIIAAIDFRYGYVFAGCLVLSFLLIFFCVIEGQNVTLEEIDTAYIIGVTPWKSRQILSQMGKTFVAEGALKHTESDKDAGAVSENERIKEA